MKINWNVIGKDGKRTPATPAQIAIAKRVMRLAFLQLVWRGIFAVACIVALWLIITGLH